MEKKSLEELADELAKILGAPALRVVKVPKAANWSENHERYFGKEGEAGVLPCVLCGRPIKELAQTHMLRDIGGGAGIYLHPDDAGLYVADGADMGAYPIGPDCLRAHPELKPFVTRKAK